MEHALAVAALAGCYRKERDEARAEAAVCDAQRNEALAVVARLEAENSILKLPPRYYFDQAVAATKDAETTNTDDADADATAIAKFDEVVQRFASDPLAKEAARKIADLRKRIADRSASLRRAQAAVARLIETCRQAALAARQTELDSVRFVGWN